MEYSSEVLFVASCFKLAILFVLVAIVVQEVIRIRKSKAPKFTKGPR